MYDFVFQISLSVIYVVINTGKVDANLRILLLFKSFLGPFILI